MDERRIIELYSARDEAAIKETEREYGRLCYRVAYNILGNAEDAEECVNDTLLAVWNKIPQAVIPGNLKAFVCRIARNTALKKLEYNTAAKRSPSAAVSLAELEEIVPDNSVPPDSTGENISEAISSFLRLQKPEARKVFVRRYWFFEPISEIAKRFSFSESKVKSMLYHTRKKLRSYLTKEGIEI